MTIAPASHNTLTNAVLMQAGQRFVYSSVLVGGDTTMKGKSKPRSPRKKKNDTDKLEQLADKKARRREKKQALKMLQKKSKRTGKVVSHPEA